MFRTRRQIVGKFRGYSAANTPQFIRDTADNTVKALVNENYDIISGTPSVPTFADLPAASSNNKSVFLVEGLGMNGLFFKSNNSEWLLQNGVGVLSMSRGRIGFVAAANTFTSISVASGSTQGAGNSCVLSSAGIHSITAASIGASVKLTGTNWNASDNLYKIIAVPTTTSIEVLFPYSGALGVPTITFNGVKVTLRSFTIPAMSIYSLLLFDITFKLVNNANNKNTSVEINSTNTVYSQANASTANIHIQSNLKQNGVTNAQVLSYPSSVAASFGSAGTTKSDLGIDMSVPTTCTISVSPDAAGDACYLDNSVCIWMQ